MLREFHLWRKDPACLALSAAGIPACLFCVFAEEELYIRLESTIMWLVLFAGLSACMIFGRDYDHSSRKIRLLIESRPAIYFHQFCLLYMAAALICLLCAVYLYCWNDILVYTQDNLSAISGDAPYLDAATRIRISAEISFGLFLCLSCYFSILFLAAALCRKSIAAAACCLLLFLMENRFHIFLLPQNLLFGLIEKLLFLGEAALQEMTALSASTLLCAAAAFGGGLLQR